MCTMLTFMTALPAARARSCRGLGEGGGGEGEGGSGLGEGGGGLGDVLPSVASKWHSANTGDKPGMTP